MFEFEIVEVLAGWFDVKIKNDEQEAIITCSDYRLNDGAKELLKILIEMFDYSNLKKEMYWDEEPGENLWNLCKEDENILYDIYYINTMFEDKKEHIISGSAKYSEFVIAVLEEFKKYSSDNNLKIYNKEWFEFPNEEYNLLLEIAKEF